MFYLCSFFCKSFHGAISPSLMVLFNSKIAFSPRFAFSFWAPLLFHPSPTPCRSAISTKAPSSCHCYLWRASYQHWWSSTKRKETMSILENRNNWSLAMYKDLCHTLGFILKFKWDRNWISGASMQWAALMQLIIPCFFIRVRTQQAAKMIHQDQKFSRKTERRIRQQWCDKETKRTVTIQALIMLE